MPQLTTRDLTRTKEAVAALLEQLGLSAYLFDIEPGSDGAHWEIRIDCEAAGGWQSLSWPIDPDRLQRSATDAPTRADVLSEWREVLSGCLRQRER